MNYTDYTNYERYYDDSEIKENIKNGDVARLNKMLLNCDNMNMTISKMKRIIDAGATELDGALVVMALRGYELDKVKFLIEKGAKIDLEELYDAIYRRDHGERIPNTNIVIIDTSAQPRRYNYVFGSKYDYEKAHAKIMEYLEEKFKDTLAVNRHPKLVKYLHSQFKNSNLTDDDIIKYMGSIFKDKHSDDKFDDNENC